MCVLCQKSAAALSVMGSSRLGLRALLSRRCEVVSCPLLAGATTVLGSSRTSAVHPGSALPAPPSCVCTSQQVLVRLCGLCSQPNLQRDNTFSKRKALLRHQLLCCQPVIVPWVSLMLPPSAACHCRLCPEPGHLPQATCVGSAALHEPGLCTACLQAGCVPWQAAIASYPLNCLMLSVQVLGAACSCSACTSSAPQGPTPTHACCRHS